MSKVKLYMPKCKSCGEQLRFNGQGDLVAFAFLKMAVEFKCKCGKKRKVNMATAEKENASSGS